MYCMSIQSLYDQEVRTFDLKYLSQSNFLLYYYIHVEASSSVTHTHYTVTLPLQHPNTLPQLIHIQSQLTMGFFPLPCSLTPVRICILFGTTRLTGKKHMYCAHLCMVQHTDTCVGGSFLLV
jgi:hypothetical protein